MWRTGDQWDFMPKAAVEGSKEQISADQPGWPGSSRSCWQHSPDCKQMNNV